MIDRNQECPDTVILLQHPPVYTMGTGSSEDYLNFDIKNAPFDVYRTERGGEVTYHGPGQVKHIEYHLFSYQILQMLKLMIVSECDCVKM